MNTKLCRSDHFSYIPVALPKGALPNERTSKVLISPVTHTHMQSKKNKNENEYKTETHMLAHTAYTNEYNENIRNDGGKGQRNMLLSQFDPSFASFTISSCWCGCTRYHSRNFFLFNELKTQSNDSESKKMAIELFTSD